jgi:type II secretory ATPase GspE/PulE/Tfp pilus assembly ATPase PilB-like protein
MEPKGDEVAAAESNMEAALANVTSALIESSQSLPINNDANRQLLEEVVQSELGDIEEADIQSMKEAQNASVMLLAHEIIGKASQKRCSDIHLEPDKTGVALRYFLHGELLADCILPLEIHRALVGSYKIIAGLDPKEINKPQDKKFTCMVEEDEIELRITTLPSEIGEMVAISMRYPD